MLPKKISNRQLVWAGTTLALLILMRHFARDVGWTIDDAFITFRYSENFARGFGPVYNASERVEGYTCFSWMSLLAVFTKFGVPTIVAAKSLGMLFTCGSVVLIAVWYRVDDDFSPTDATLCALGVATSRAFTQWGPSAMETSLFCFAALSVAYCYLSLNKSPTFGHALLLGTLGTLFAMTRPNAIVFLCVTLAHALYTRVLPARVIKSFVGTFAVLYGSYFAWRWSYYGHFLPNTFYAKVGGTSAQLNRGIRYLIRAMPAFGVIASATALSWGRPRARPPKRSNPRALYLAMVVSHLAYVIAVGGDNFPAHRFIVVVVPFLWLLGVQSLQTLAPTSLRRSGLAALLIGYNFVAYGFDPETGPRVRRDYVASAGTTTGRWLARFTEEDDLIATNSAGALAYYSERAIVDTLGLNDATIAHTHMSNMGRGKAGHEKGNGEYVFSRKPDFVFFGGPHGSKEPMFTGDHELFAIPDFQKIYVFEKKEFDGETLRYYRRLSAEELAKREEEARVKAENKEKKKKNGKKKRKKKAAALGTRRGDKSGSTSRRDVPEATNRDNAERSGQKATKE